jgi:hypothetical protein
MILATTHNSVFQSFDEKWSESVLHVRVTVLESSVECVMCHMISIYEARGPHRPNMGTKHMLDV